MDEIKLEWGWEHNYTHHPLYVTLPELIDYLRKYHGDASGECTYIINTVIHIIP